jgi:hypothetical protein
VLAAVEKVLRTFSTDENLRFSRVLRTRDRIPAIQQAVYPQPAHAEATDSELGPDDIIVRYRGDEVIGLTILHASSRSRVNGK